MPYRINTPAHGLHTNRPDRPPRVGPRPLPGRTVDALQLEHGKPRHSHALQSVALSMVNAGCTEQDFLERGFPLARAAAEQDSHGRTPSTANVRRSMGRAWGKAQARAQASPAVHDAFTVRRTIAQAQALADCTPWGGQAGNGNRAVLAAVLAIAEREDSLLLALSVRRVAEEAGVGTGTAARVLERLTRLGWLVKVEAAREDRATRYRLTVPQAPEQAETGQAEAGLSAVSLAELVAHDAFAPAALGRTAARVLAALDDMQWQSPADLARRLGLRARTIGRALEALEAVGLAYRQARGRGSVWVARPEQLEALDDIAADLGTAGRAAGRALAHERQRWGYSLHLERMREDKARRLWESKEARKERAAAAFREQAQARERARAQASPAVA